MNPRRLAPVLAAAALAGCGGGQPDGGVAGVETVRDSPRRRRVRHPRGGLDWIRRFSDWAFRFAEQGGKVRAYESGAGFELGRYRRLLEPFRTCEDAFLDQVGRAPTQRLQPAERNLVEAWRNGRATRSRTGT